MDAIFILLNVCCKLLQSNLHVLSINSATIHINHCIIKPQMQILATVETKYHMICKWNLLQSKFATLDANICSVVPSLDKLHINVKLLFFLACLKILKIPSHKNNYILSTLVWKLGVSEQGILWSPEQKNSFFKELRRSKLWDSDQWENLQFQT